MGNRIDKDDVKRGCDLRDYARSLGDLGDEDVDYKLSEKEANVVTKCPSCGRKRSYVIYHDGFYCHACFFKGDQIDYVMHRDGCDFHEALEVLNRFVS